MIQEISILEQKKPILEKILDSNAEKLYNTLLTIYFNQNNKYNNPEKLLLKGFKYLLNQRKMKKVNHSQENLLQNE